MKLSVSLPEEDVAFLDEYTAEGGASSRSAVLHEAVRLLRTSHLEQEYEHAWDEWESTGENEVWDATAADGLDATR